MTCTFPCHARCGTHTGYSMGCRAEPCTLAHRSYTLEKTRARRRPDGVGPAFIMIDASEVREHLLWLQSHGVGWRQVLAVSGVRPRSVQAIRAGTQKKVRSDTAARLLAIHLGKVKTRTQYAKDSGRTRKKVLA